MNLFQRQAGKIDIQTMSTGVNICIIIAATACINVFNRYPIAEHYISACFGFLS